jgi:hypothetical protein
MACEEMDMFYAYLDAVEQAKRMAQPWECEVTLIGDDGVPKPMSAPMSKPALDAATAGANLGTKPGFVCDEPE